MPAEVPFADRLRKGIARVDAQAADGTDAEALKGLRRSLERTLAALEPGNSGPRTVFRFRRSGGKPLLFQGSDALPIEPSQLSRLLNSTEIVLLPDEFLDVDGALAAMMIRSEVNLTDTELRRADQNLRALKTKTGRDRDHAAAQTADSLMIRLRSRLTQLVSALQAAQRDTPDKKS